MQHPSRDDRILYLMYDPVHILKNIRNNWINEKKQTLMFHDGHGNLNEAKWEPLKELYRHEISMFCSNSHLTAASIKPSNLEKQRVHLVLNVFL